MHLLVLSPYLIRLMHGHGLFKILMLIEADLNALSMRILCLTHTSSCSESFLELFHKSRSTNSNKNNGARQYGMNRKILIRYYKCNHLK